MIDPSMPLPDFIAENLEELVARAGARVDRRSAPSSGAAEADGVRQLFARIAKLLKATLGGAAAPDERASSEATRSQQLFAQGLTIAQVVHGYGDLSHAVTELAVERGIGISTTDFQAFNDCLEGAIAGAVTEYSRLRAHSLAVEATERLGALAEELLRGISAAMYAFDSIKRGAAGTLGSVSRMLTASLSGLRDLVERAFTEMRLDAGLLQAEQVPVSELIADAESSGRFRGRAHNLELFVSSVEPELFVHVDRRALAGALANLLQNASRFSRPDSLVSLNVYATATRVCIDVQDECGGLPSGTLDRLAHSPERNGARPEAGLGLAIVRRTVEANGGELRVLDLPLFGCRFTIDLPRCRPRAQGPLDGHAPFPGAN